MTPKEKANELYSRYYNRIEHTLSEEYSPHEKDVVKQCVLIAVDEIFEFMRMDDDHEDAHFVNSKWVNYYVEVKKEIEKL